MSGALSKTVIWRRMALELNTIQGARRSEGTMPLDNVAGDHSNAIRRRVLLKPGDHTQRRRLAADRTVKQRDEFALVHAEIDSIDRATNCPIPADLFRMTFDVTRSIHQT